MEIQKTRTYEGKVSWPEALETLAIALVPASIIISAGLVIIGLVALALWSQDKIP